MLGAVLISLSTAGYFPRYFIFRYARHIFIYLSGDLVFTNVLLVALILHPLLSCRERRVLDMKRAYLQPLSERPDYMRYLGAHCRYLFSWAARTNHFGPAAPAVIK
ncbi:MAG: hypothetical protein PHU54_06875 [Candidatus Omnitrophica bacterium]|nr:hypothetical protein [Candidatus Omnitrophota bacterium]